jgi:alpha-tubulin suppressor-like RCC1 family protein
MIKSVVPLMIKRSRVLQKIACGFDHILVKTNMNKNRVEVFSMLVGRNDHPNFLGRDKASHSGSLAWVNPSGKDIENHTWDVVDIAAGNAHSIIIARDGGTFVFGDFMGMSSDLPTKCWDGLEPAMIRTGQDFAVARDTSGQHFVLCDPNEAPEVVDFTALFGSSYKVHGVSVGPTNACFSVKLESESDFP